MYRGVGLVVAVGMSLSACGGGPGAAQGTATTPSRSPSSSSSPTATYLADADSSAINAVAVPVQDAMAAAVQKSPQCEKAGKDQGYGAWRKCWHRLLDPAVRGLSGSSTVFDRLATKDLPDDCVARLGQFSEVLRGHARTITGVLSGIDGDDRAGQRRALKAMDPALRAAHQAFADRIPPLTSACYSPEFLASLNASPSASPSATPSG